MKWLLLAICAEVGVLLCLIFSFDGALYLMQSARLTWDHVAVAIVYAYVRTEFSRRRRIFPTTLRARSASHKEALPVRS